MLDMVQGLGMDPNQQGLFGLGARLMAAGGPTQAPMNMGARMGQAGLGFMQDLQQAQQLAVQKKLREMQISKMEDELKTAERMSKIRSKAAKLAEEHIQRQSDQMPDQELGAEEAFQRGASQGLGQPYLSPKLGLASTLVSGGLEGAYGQGSDDMVKMGLGMTGLGSAGGSPYGGVQYAYDPAKKQYVPYLVDKTSRAALPITTPPGTVATVPSIPQIGEGGHIFTVPSRGVPGVPTPATGTGLRTMPTAEETKQVGHAEAAFGMGREMRRLVESGSVQVGSVRGRRLRAAGLTGMRLTKDDATMLSLEENLSNQLLQAARGAQVGPQEQTKYERSLPRVDQPRELFLANITTTMDNLATLRRMASQLRPVPPPGAASPGRRPEHTALIDQARKAIKAGKDPEAVKGRLREMGIDPSGL